MNTFARWLQANNLSHAAFGRLAGWSRVRVGRYANGSRTPDADAFAVIYRLTDGAVTPNDFFALPSSPAGQQPVPPAAPVLGGHLQPAGALSPAGSFSEVAA